MSEKRLIDANALLEDLGFPEDDRDRLINLIIDRAPTIDAVEVVRCRDCVYAKPIPAARRKDYFDPDRLRHCALMRTEADVYGVCALHDDCYCDEGKRKEATDGRSD